MAQGRQHDSKATQGLLNLARSAILDNLGSSSDDIDLSGLDAELNSPCASYVRLSINGQLRGENGSPTSHQQLQQSVRQNAYKAAFNDPRFQPIKIDELDQLDVEVSLVTPLQPIEAESVAQLGDHLEPMIDGLLVETEYGEFSLFPDNWPEHVNTRMFITQLMRKAYIDPREWNPDYKWYKFQTLTYCDDTH